MVDYNILRTLTMAKCVLRVLCPSLRTTADIGGVESGKDLKIMQMVAGSC